MERGFLKFFKEEGDRLKAWKSREIFPCFLLLMVRFGGWEIFESYRVAFLLKELCGGGCGGIAEARA